MIINQLKQQLLNFYKSRSIFNSYIIKNKFMLITFFLLILITFIFNKNINYFKDLDIYEINTLTIILSFVTFYLIYIKFNIMVRMISLVKSIPYFFKNIKLKKITDIKIICLYYYLFNIFFILLSILFITNLHHNLTIVNIPNLIDYTNILSVILLIFNFNNIINKEINIKNNICINYLSLLNLVIIVISVLGIHYYQDQIKNLFDVYFIKKFTIYCDSTGNIDLDKKLKGKSLEIITHSNSVSIGNHNSNFFVKSPSHLENSNLNASSSSKVMIQNEEINSNINSIIDTTNYYDILISNLNQISTEFLHYFIMENARHDTQFSDLMFNNFYHESEIIYKIDTKLINFLNEYITMVSKNNNIISDYLIEYFFRLYDLDLVLKHKINLIVSDYNTKLNKIEDERFNALKFYIPLNLSPFIMDKINETFFVQIDPIYAILQSGINELEAKQLKDLEVEIEKFQNKGNLFSKLKQKALHYFDSYSNSNTNTNTKTSSIDDLSDFKDLFYKSNKSSTSISSIDSDETIKPTKKK
jgi:hypothetical protein